MTYARFRRARNQDQDQPHHVQDAQLLDDAHHAYIREQVMAARLEDIPTDYLLAPLEVVALERAEAAGYVRP